MLSLYLRLAPDAACTFLLDFFTGLAFLSAALIVGLPSEYYYYIAYTGVCQNKRISVCILYYIFFCLLRSRPEYNSQARCYSRDTYLVRAFSEPHKTIPTMTLRGMFHFLLLSVNWLVCSM